MLTLSPSLGKTRGKWREGETRVTRRTRINWCARTSGTKGSSRKECKFDNFATIEWQLLSPAFEGTEFRVFFFLQGTPGLAGQTGERGDAGPDGAKGQTGTDGTKGEKGRQGGPGDKGPRGPKGATGMSGTPGSKGMPGGPGMDGMKGRRGPAGHSGVPGQSGPRVSLTRKERQTEIS